MLGHGYLAELEAALKPLVHKYHVTFYMAGHDHSLQYLIDEREAKTWTNYTAHHYVVGNAARPNPDVIFECAPSRQSFLLQQPPHRVQC